MAAWSVLCECSFFLLNFSFSAREANIVSNTDYAWRYSDYVPLPPNPMFYQINLPTYMEEECEQFLLFQLTRRLHSLRDRHQSTRNHSTTRSQRYRTARSGAIQLRCRVRYLLGGAIVFSGLASSHDWYSDSTERTDRLDSRTEYERGAGSELGVFQYQLAHLSLSSVLHAV